MRMTAALDRAPTLAPALVQKSGGTREPRRYTTPGYAVRRTLETTIALMRAPWSGLISRLVALPQVATVPQRLLLIAQSGRPRAGLLAPPCELIAFDTDCFLCDPGPSAVVSG